MFKIIACNFLYFLQANYSHLQNIDVKFFPTNLSFRIEVYFLTNAAYIR